MRDYPILDARTREDFLDELAERAAGGGLAKGGLLYTLLSLYADMLEDTASRLNRTPEKHRLAFLNLQQCPRRPSCPGSTIAVFRTVEGYDDAVSVPEGSLVAAQTGHDPILYRTRAAFDAIPARICDIIWSDGEADTVASICVCGEDEHPGPFCLWQQETPNRGRHTVEFRFENVFVNTVGNHEILLETVLLLDGKPIDNSVLTDSAKFILSISFVPDAQDEPPLSVQAEAHRAENKVIQLLYSGSGHVCSAACLCIELLDAAFIGLEFEDIHVHAQRRGIQPEAVIAGDRELDGSDFYPFQNPMRSMEECFIFCGDALLRTGAQIAVDFDLLLEQTTEKLPEEQQEIDYRWIMKRPPKKTEPEIFEAFARSVQWEYWNGTAYCALRGSIGAASDFTVAANRLRLLFDCPADIAQGSAGGRLGGFLRLSSGLCDALYRLPRRVHTPRVLNLEFSYRYRQPVFPVGVASQNFGERRQHLPGQAVCPFCRPPQGKQLFLGLDRLVPNAQLRIFFNMGNRQGEKQPFLTAGLAGEPPQRLAMDDGTCGLTRSGIIGIVSPEKPEPYSVFGRTRYWLNFMVGGQQSQCAVAGVYLNAQQVENRVRNKQYSAYSAIGLDCELRLAGGNIVKAWVFVRAQDSEGWEEWKEYSLLDGAFREGFYTLDYKSGLLTFPAEIAARGAGAPGEDFVGVTYDTCDGAEGNVAAGAIDRMQEEIPFIDDVYNPLPVRNGEDSESDEQLAARAEHRLYHGGRAVTARDIELMARDIYPQIHRAKCVAGRPVKLVLLLCEGMEGMNFPQIQAGLLEKLGSRGCMEAAGAQTEILEAVRVPIGLNIRFLGKRHVLSATLEQFKKDMTAFLNPVSGGLCGDGWPIGTLPTCEQLKAFATAKMPELRLCELIATAAGGGLDGDLSEIVPKAFNVPGAVQIALEVVW